MPGKSYVGYITSGVSLGGLLLYHTAKAHHPELPELNVLNCLYPILSISTIGGLIYSYVCFSKQVTSNELITPIEPEYIEGEYRPINDSGSIDKKI